MQLLQTLSSAVAQIKVLNSPITNHTKTILPQRPPPFFNKDKFLVDCLMGEGFPALFSPLAAVVVKGRF